MKIAIVSSRFPYPLNKGDKLRLFHQIRILSAKHQIILISLSDSPVSDADQLVLKEFCEQIHIFYLSKSSIFWNMLKGLLKGLPVQVGYFYSNNIQQKINTIVDLEKPDHIYCQLIRTAEYAKSWKLPKTLDYMDCFYLSTIKRAQHSRGLENWFWQFESWRVKNYERDIYPYFNRHTIISTSDRKAMGFEDSRRLTVVPNGLNEDYFLNLEPLPVRDIDILFLGNLGYFSNIAAVDFLLHEIIPKLKRKGNLKIVIAGAQASEKIKSWVAAIPGVELIENPSDTRQVYQRAKLFVAPIFAGTGQQNKILEAIASSCMVICTPEVQSALHIKSPEFIHVQQTADGFALEIEALLKQPDYFLQQSSHAKEYIRTHFSWEKNTAILESLLTESA